MKKIRDKKITEDFYLNDMHEANFMVDKNGIIRVIDIDSCKIGNNKISTSKYLNPFSQIAEMPYKYYQNHDYTSPGFIVPNNDSELYCYIIMILNYIYDGKITELSIEEFYTYMQYLKDIGFDKDLVDNFSNIYEYKNNENPYQLLETLPSNLGQASNKVFKKVANIK